MRIKRLNWPSWFSKRARLLARLSEEELKLVIAQRQAIYQQQVLLKMMSDGHNATWWVLRTKYKLPTEFDFNSKTGELREKEKDG